MDEWKNNLVSHFPSLSVSLCVDQERKNERTIEKQKKILATGLSFVDKSLTLHETKKNMTNEQKWRLNVIPGLRNHLGVPGGRTISHLATAQEAFFLWQMLSCKKMMLWN